METVVYSRVSRRDLRELLRAVPAMLSGNGPDPFGLGRGFRLRLAVAFFSTIKQAFIDKARGGTDEAGDSWPPLSARYLAYQRPTTGRTPPRAGKQAPGGKDGFLTEGQLKQWRQDYRRALAYLALKMPLDEAKRQAARTAWTKAKRAGAQTKLAAFGNREVEILRDRGLLFNSLSPGLLAGDSYTPPEGQVAREGGGELVVGTNVAYAAFHHGERRKTRGRGALPQRRLWPSPERFPASWWDGWREVALSGVDRALALIVGRAA